MARRTAEQQAAERERVVAATARAWGEPVRVFELDPPFLLYRVRGRESHGDRKPPKDYSGWGMLLWLFDVPGFLLALLEPVIEGLLWWSMRDRVRGEEGSGAVRFADAFRQRADWLVWSPTRTALVKLLEDGETEVAWLATGSDRPELRLPRRLRWADGSRIKLASFQSDRRRYYAESAALAR